MWKCKKGLTSVRAGELGLVAQRRCCHPESARKASRWSGCWEVIIIIIIIHYQIKIQITFVNCSQGLLLVRYKRILNNVCNGSDGPLKDGDDSENLMTMQEKNCVQMWSSKHQFSSSWLSFSPIWSLSFPSWSDLQWKLKTKQSSQGSWIISP